MYIQATMKNVFRTIGWDKRSLKNTSIGQRLYSIDINIFLFLIYFTCYKACILEFGHKKYN